jgi:hypothetical protein
MSHQPISHKSNWKKYSLFSLPWIAVTLFFVGYMVIKPLFSAAIFGLDGLDYATLAIHLLHHVGTAWSPEFTATRFTHFYEHPPIGIWYFAIFYKVFGTSWHTDKIIALFDATWMISIIALFFRRDFPKATRWLIWLPILLFLTNPMIALYIDSNKLECVELPLSLTVLYWMSQCRWRSYSLKSLSMQSVVIGPICVIGFELNGLLFLYLWAGYIICALTSNQIILKRAALLTGLLVMSSLAFYGLLMWLVPAARHNNIMYFSTQLLPSLFGQRTDDLYNMHGINRIRVIGLYLRYIAPWIMIAIAGWVLLELRSYYCNNKQKTTAYSEPYSDKNLQNLLFYIILACATTLPLLASGKILNYYNLQTNAFLALMLCCLITPALQALYQATPTIRTFFINLIFAPLLGYAFCWPSIFYLKPFYQFNLSGLGLNAAQILQKYIPKNSIVSIPPHILPYAITYLEANMARFMNVSLMASGGCEYYIDSIYNILPPPKDYHKIDTPMILLTLYKRNHALPSCKPQHESLKGYHAYGFPLKFFI